LPTGIQWVKAVVINTSIGRTGI